jgi:hypothetical protein
MRDPYYHSFPHGQGLRAQIVYCIDVIARLVVGLMGLWFILFMMLYLFGDVPPWPHHR